MPWLPGEYRITNTASWADSVTTTAGTRLLVQYDMGTNATTSMTTLELNPWALSASAWATLSTMPTTTRATVPVPDREIEPASRAPIEARERAEQLLREHLNWRQLREYERDRCFRVVSQQGHRYRIRFGFSRNVERLDAHGQPAYRLCLHPSGQRWEDYPEGDVMLAQKFLLETDEERFLAKANVAPLALVA